MHPSGTYIHTFLSPRLCCSVGKYVHGVSSSEREDMDSSVSGGVVAMLVVLLLYHFCRSWRRQQRGRH